MTSIEIIILGTPAPQGSKHGYAVKSKGAYTGKVAQVESSAKVKPWRMAVKYAAMEEINLHPNSTGWLPMTGAVVVGVVFRLPRPKGHYGTGRNVALLKPSAPWCPAGRPDLDKLLRSTFDALGEAGVWGDDAQVVTVRGAKKYATDYEPIGATIHVTSLVNVVETAVA
jgi:crossover junction endodeoxyribonuclease RusA